MSPETAETQCDELDHSLFIYFLTKLWLNFIFFFMQIYSFIP